jgi:hypothetical protein
MNKKLVYLLLTAGGVYLFIKSKKLAESTAAKMAAPKEPIVGNTPMSAFTRG